MIDFYKDPLFEEARLYAESQMPDNWDRHNGIDVATFYQHFAAYIYTTLRPYKKIAENVSAIFHYGKFQVETPAEAELEKQLIHVGLWPTTEDEILKRKQ